MNDKKELNKSEDKNQNNIIQNQDNNLNTNNSNKRKTNYKNIVIIAVIAIILISGISGTIIIKEIYNNKKMVNKDNISSSNNKNEDNNENIITNSEENNQEEMPTTNKKTKDDLVKADEEKEKKLLEEIKNKIGISFNIINIFADVYYNKEYDAAKINQSVRTALVSSYVLGEKEYTRSERDSYSSYSVASKKRIEELYEKVYGKKITITEKSFDFKYPIEGMKEGIRTGTILSCPFFKKIEGDDIYFSHNCGGGYYPLRLQSLFYDYKENNNTIEVYVATTVVTDVYEDNYITISTGSINYNEVYDYFPKDEEFHLNEKNKDKFTNFKLTFTKNEQGNYIFTKSELI